MLIGCYRLTDGEWKRFDIIAKTPSMIWTRRFFEEGSFQLQTKKNVLKEYDIIVQGNNAGIVLRTAEISGIVNVYGYDLKGIARFRKFSAETIGEVSAETKIKTWATTYLATGKRTIEGLTVAESKGVSSLLPAAEIADGNFADILAAQSKAADLGWDISFNSGKLVFDVIEPREKTEIVFSRKRRNLEEAERIVDYYDVVNATTENDSVRGIRRREGDEFVNPSNYITGTSNANAKDYKLGDYVTVEEYGVSARLQITQIQYVYEPNNIIVVPSFGEVKQNIIKKLMKG